MKKFCSLLLLLALVFSFTACSVNSDPSSDDPSDEAGQKESDSGNSDQDSLGNYSVRSVGYALAKDYEGHDAIIISYDFTNNSAETTSAGAVLYIQVFQGGVELESAILSDAPEGYSSENEWKNIRPGTTLNCHNAYVLSNTSSPVDVEISQAFSFSDAKVTFAYDISSGALADLSSNSSSSAPSDNPVPDTGNSEGTLGNYYASLTGYTLAKDHEGHNVIIVSYDFTNNSAEATSAALSLSLQAFQDGVELDSAFLLDAPKGYTSENAWKDIKTGVTLNCQSAFVLFNTNSPVEVEATELFSFSGTMVSCTYDIAKG